MPLNIKNRIYFLVNLLYYSAIILLCYIGVKYVLAWIMPFFLAFCIVSVVNPIIRFVNRKLRVGKKAASITVMVLVYLLTGFLLFEIILQAINIFKDLFVSLPGYFDQTIAPALNEAGKNLTDIIQGLPSPLGEGLQGVQGELVTWLKSMLLSLSQWGVSVISSFTGHLPAFIIAFIFTIMLSFFISMQYDSVTGFISAQLPAKIKNIIMEFKTILNDIIFRYLSAMAKIVSITFVELSIGLMVLRTPNAIAIAAGVAVFDALPLFGTGTILIPWAVITLIQGDIAYAVGLIIIYAIITLVRNIIEPHVVGKKLGLNPIVSVVSIYLGFKLIGVFGMIIMPITTQIIIELHNKGVIKLFNQNKNKTDGFDPEDEKYLKKEK